MTWRDLFCRLSKIFHAPVALHKHWCLFSFADFTGFFTNAYKTPMIQFYITDPAAQKSFA